MRQLKIYQDDGDIVDYTPMRLPPVDGDNEATLDDIDNLTAGDNGVTTTYDPCWLDEKEID
ncbi:hypothetical protein [uncultured Corynebacterium sp.]|uniref:hypothetical protein n=1 Tax=uncultured Corynebacterium sp. TaxID=159447 RepID=UPI0026245A51|nr:hypothetical protein [uncultured Corynebacterium sp.]